MPDFKIIPEWLGGMDSEFCRLGVTSDKLNLTAHKGSQESDKILVSARPLAEWLLASIWRILHEPGPGTGIEKLNHSWRMAHELQAAGGGFFWPNATFFSCGENVEIRASTAFYGQEMIYAERYTEAGSDFVSRKHFKDAVCSFLKAASERNAAIKTFVNLLNTEFNDKEKKRYRELEAMLGYDPNGAPNDIINLLVDKIESAGLETVEELACGLNPINFDCVQNQLELARERLEPVQDAPKGDISVSLKEKPNLDLPWDYGRECAHMLRTECGVSQDDPLETNTLLDCAGLDMRQFEKIPQTGAISACAVENKKVSFSFQTVFSPAARRFQLARVLGDYLALRGNCKYLVVSHASTWQQQMQRNFAAELLAPAHSIKNLLDEKGWTPDNFLEVANRYQVTPRTIGHNLMNQQMASRGNVERILSEM